MIVYQAFLLTNDQVLPIDQCSFTKLFLLTNDRLRKPFLLTSDWLPKLSYWPMIVYQVFPIVQWSFTKFLLLTNDRFPLFSYWPLIVYQAFLLTNDRFPSFSIGQWSVTKLFLLTNDRLPNFFLLPKRYRFRLPAERFTARPILVLEIFTILSYCKDLKDKQKQISSTQKHVNEELSFKQK